MFTFLIEQNRFECGEYVLCSLVPLSGSLAFKNDLFDLHIVVCLPAHNSASIYIFIAVIFTIFSVKELEKLLA